MKTDSIVKKDGIGTYIPDAESSVATVEVKSRLSDGRSMRNGLVQLVSILTEFSNKRAHLLLIDPRIKIDNLYVEFNRFKSALRPDIASRLFMHVVCRGRFVKGKENIPYEDQDLLDKCISNTIENGYKLSRIDAKSEVFRVILNQWICGRGPMTSRWLEKTVGCSYRTVAGTIKYLGNAVERYTDARIQLKYFPTEYLSQFFANSAIARSTMLFVDRSDQPRSPESLVRRLYKLGRSDIAVGGVLGAKRYYSDLDIIGTPRLDLCIHCTGKYIDLDFIKLLDPALECSSDQNAPTRLALHFVRRNDPLFDKDENDIPWADPVECLFDLQEAYLEPLVASFLEYLSERGGTFSG